MTDYNPTSDTSLHSFVSSCRIAVIGLGYVGLPIARLFSQRFDTVGYDINERLINSLKESNNPESRISFTGSPEEMAQCNVFIVAVPTPVDRHNNPDILPLLKACDAIAGVLKKDDIVIFESTVYPGMTEEECVPVLEKRSGLKYNIDFFTGYSPERINPGDSLHAVENIVKVTSGSTMEVAEKIDALYNYVLKNGTHKASSIKVAEAAKIIENVQRDVNIALINEFAKIFNAMDIDTHAVLNAASTKWNFIDLRPGLVGGHCISVDPYYLIQKAQVFGVKPRIITVARELNDSMGEYVAEQAIKVMNRKGVRVKDASVLILGITFKENCDDIRNSRIVDIVDTLKDYTDRITIFDPLADAGNVKSEYGLDIIGNPDLLESKGYDLVIHAVAHDEFLSLDIRNTLLRDAEESVVFDVKGVLPLSQIDARL